jgi:hypothetical protein
VEAKPLVWDGKVLNKPDVRDRKKRLSYSSCGLETLVAKKRAALGHSHAKEAKDGGGSS